MPIEDTVGAIVNSWTPDTCAISEVGSETIRRAVAVRPISDLQIEYSLATRGIERDILGTCRELGVGVTAYGGLSRGLISGHWTKSSGVHGDSRASGRRFSGDNLDRNLSIVETLRGVADELGITVAQSAIAWWPPAGTT